MSTQLTFRFYSIRLLAVAGILLLPGLSSKSFAAYEYVGQFGTTGTAKGQFDSPRGVVVNHAGRIIITDTDDFTSSRVQLCGESGNDCSDFGSIGDLSGEFDKPRGLAVNSEDRIFIADRGNDRIASCASTGSCTDFGGSGLAVGQFESPRGIAIDSQNRIYITDTDHDRIQLCDDQGVCTAFGSFGSALGQFSSPSGIAVDSQGRLIIADRGNDRIQICTTGGSCSAFGSFGTAAGKFNLPAGVAVDSRDRIIVADRRNDRIQVCTDQGSCTVFGSFGTGNGQFDAPWGVAVDGNDRIIVADTGNNRIQIFSEPASPVVNISSFSANPGSITEGDSTALSWVVSNATSCTALAGTGSWQALNPSASGGTANISIATAGNYTFTLSCTDGSNTVQADTSVNVSAAPLVVAITSFSATPGVIEKGQSTTLSWVVANATSCTALAGTGSWQALNPSASGGTANISIATAGNYTFTLSCTDGSNTVQADTSVIVTAFPALAGMNVGLNDAWYYPVTNGQGFFITVFPDIGYVSLAWFTYETERPGDGVTANLGEPGHRWLVALGAYAGNQAVMDVSFATGGLFDSTKETSEVSDGTIILTFADCRSGTVEYDIPSIGQTGIVPIERVVGDNIALCEALTEQAAIQQSSAAQSKNDYQPQLTDVPVTAAELPLLVDMNVGLNDAWYNPATNGQGFFITIFPDIGYVSLAWFTYDTERPGQDVTANLGEPGHRWLVALGAYAGNQSVLDISFATGGVFDSPIETSEVSDGTMILTFTDCNSGTVEYDIPSIGQTGTVVIERVVGDNIALCETLAQ